ncbi:Phospholipase D1 [Elasticomyces elasticus]|nr:Phospholipase D1 [Elasticomyces elasticus]
MTDIPEDSRASVSEDEGRDRLAGKSAWRRGLQNARGLSHKDVRQRNHFEGSGAEASGQEGSAKRPSNFRRFTGIAALSGEKGADDANASSPHPFRLRPSDRGNSTAAAKWRSVKAGIKLLAQRRRIDERAKVDHAKSAELMAELLAGTPSVLFFASMYQRDEHGHRKIPVLLEQLKITIPHSQIKEGRGGDRHMIFHIELEYGSGDSRMKWTIHRSLRDFTNLHLKFKVQSQTDRLQLKGEDRSRAKLPRFPRTAFPYLRGVRGLGDEDNDDFEDDEQHHTADASGTDNAAEASGTENTPTRPALGPKKHSRRSSLGFTRRKSGVVGADATPSGRPGSFTGVTNHAREKEKEKAKERDLYAERQKRKLEIYLQQMIRWLIFRPDSNRLCKFLELSALGVRLCVEGGYHGKEGIMTIASRRAVGLRRRPVAPSSIADRHKPRWFMVRHSYIVCVDGPESLNIYDVFLVDEDFTTERKKLKKDGQRSAQEMAKSATITATNQKHHVLRLYNAERKLRLVARNERQFLQFQESINYMKDNTLWAKPHRFQSYAPERRGAYARWLVDGRDHMWQVSRAIDQARNTVFIHDWWLSPEIYLRRPAAISQKWRLDRLLQRKAQQGIKIFVVVYRNIESAIPIDSDYTKLSLLELHPNICVQRSPNQFRQNQFFWAHHEKLVVVDNVVAFVGGVDLCFGRWDTPQHTLIDDKLTGFELDGDSADVPKDADHCQLWPGKDYSNPRVQDFYALDRPYEEMYDRTKVPRMPWHDIAMQLVGQPARDVARHFVQRWNFILRQRVTSRPTPLLLPPPDFHEAELRRLGIDGSCHVQILRSCANWSIGTPDKIECSILNAYIRLISESEHFVYVENQFFITSCTVEGTPVRNGIGDALVERIVRAHSAGEYWRACIVIPLMPGFQNSVDAQDGTSVRLIMQCQYRSICRGETSIFARLRASGIEPSDYIEFYALRQWGKIGPRKCLTTEQLYIHAKCMVVDDRRVIIGSANINERSMLGSRDSEVAALVEDQAVIDSYMGGQPFKVAKFAHELRMRLMREHLGLDVDELDSRQKEHEERERFKSEMDMIYSEDSGVSSPASPTLPVSGRLTERNLAAKRRKQEENELKKEQTMESWINHARQEQNSDLVDQSTTEQHKRETRGLQHDLDVTGFGPDNMAESEAAGIFGLRDTAIAKGHREILTVANARIDAGLQPACKNFAAKSGSSDDTEVPDTIGNTDLPPARLPRLNTRELGLTQLSQLPALPSMDDTDIGGPPLTRTLSGASAKSLNPLLQSMKRPVVTEDCMLDPLNDPFYLDIWHVIAENNTKIYRQVFRCMPDNEVMSWSEYHEYNRYNERFMQGQGLGNTAVKQPVEAKQSVSGPPGSAGTAIVSPIPGVASAAEKTKGKVSALAAKFMYRRSSNPSSAEQDSEKMAIRLDGARDQQSSRASNAVTNGYAESMLDEKTAQRLADEADAQDDAHVASLPSISKKRTEELSRRLPETTATQSEPNMASQQKRRRRAPTRAGQRPHFNAEEILSKEDAEELLKLTQGNLVVWPYDWLVTLESFDQFLKASDRFAPFKIWT